MIIIIITTATLAGLAIWARAWGHEESPERNVALKGSTLYFGTWREAVLDLLEDLIEKKHTAPTKFLKLLDESWERTNNKPTNNHQSSEIFIISIGLDRSYQIFITNHIIHTTLAPSSTTGTTGSHRGVENNGAWGEWLWVTENWGLIHWLSKLTNCIIN